MRWIPPDTITGDAATGNRYLRRNYINEDFWREIGKGNHILFVAPRRVGKSSIMKDLEMNCPDGYYGIYQDIESVDTREGFYERLFHLLLHRVNTIDKARKIASHWWKKFEIKEISKSGIKLEKRHLNFEEEVRTMISELTGSGLNIVIFLDEFAEVIYKLYKKGHSEDAVSILHTLREMRHDKDFQHIKLVFAGSIGLHQVIREIDRPKLINDLHAVSIGALTESEATQLIRQLTQAATVQYNTANIDYLIGKVRHLLPYYLQIMIEAIDFIAHKSGDPTIHEAIINQAFEDCCRNSIHDDWLERLKDYQSGYFPFINHILKHLAHKNTISIQEVYDLAMNPDYKRTEDYMEFVEQLIREGYMNEYAPHQYCFLSPFLQALWLRKYPVYHG